jgi:hypothetical protein
MEVSGMPYMMSGLEKGRLLGSSFIWVVLEVSLFFELKFASEKES